MGAVEVGGPLGDGSSGSASVATWASSSGNGTPLSFSPATTRLSAALRLSVAGWSTCGNAARSCFNASVSTPVAPASARSNRLRRSFTVDRWAKSLRQAYRNGPTRLASGWFTGGPNDSS